MGPYMSKKTVSITFLLIAMPVSFSLPESQSVSSPWPAFSTQARNSKPMFSRVHLLIFS